MTTLHTYKTISAATHGVYKEKGSKFLSFAIPVEELEEVKEILKYYQKEYHDARHVCYAYMLGAERSEFRVSDDGEPSGTAGKPILGQINSRQLTNVLVIVVRYFGGILLGTGGLIVAYKEAASDALNQCQLITVEIKSSLTIHFDYLLLNEVMRIIKQYQPTIVNQTFDNQCVMKLAVRQQDRMSLITKFQKLAISTIDD